MRALAAREKRVRRPASGLEGLIWGNTSRRSAVAGGSACEISVLEKRPKMSLGETRTLQPWWWTPTISWLRSGLSKCRFGEQSAAEKPCLHAGWTTNRVKKTGRHSTHREGGDQPWAGRGFPLSHAAESHLGIPALLGRWPRRLLERVR